MTKLFGTGKETTMKLKVITTIFALVLIAGSVALTVSLSTGAASVSASSARNGQLHVTKNCSADTGLAGGYCMIESSNLAEITVGSNIYYDQAAGIPAAGPGIPKGMLDSNVVLVVGSGDWAVGRCTLDRATHLGLCTFSDGTGQFTGFSARVDVSFDMNTGLFHWDGTYSFSPEPPR